MASNNRDDDAKIMPPSKRLQDKIGRNTKLDNIITEERLEVAQQTAVKSLELFIASTDKDLEALEHAVKHELKSGHAGPKAVQKVIDPAFSIKSRAGVYGYELASSIARSLHHYMEDMTSLKEHDVTIVEAHIKALRGVFAHNITGHGEQIGEELIKSLENLIHKYQH